MADPSNPSLAKVVDIHTHMYPPSYVQILESRSTIPLVRKFASSPDPRLILLEAEVPSLSGADDASAKPPGRPLTKHYSSLAQKIHFMDTHKIDISVISLANPWLDFLDPSEAGPFAASVNKEFSDMCAAHPGRLFFFGTLPLTAPLPTIQESITQLKGLDYCRGVILGTSGLGKGLDDPNLLPIFQALADAGLTIFLHPHYGLPNEVWGPRASEEYGHVLPLALGFPMETTIAVARMYLAGVFDAVPSLQMILAHSGGTLPFLAGRIESCVLHDGHLVREGKVTPQRRTVWDVLRSQVYLDAVIYSEVGLNAAIEASGGADRLMFGTDHPFFPPLGTDEDGEWESVGMNAEAVNKALGEGSEKAKGVMGGNAVRVLRLHGQRSPVNWVFIKMHGGEETFGHKYAFTQHLRDLVAERLPKLDVQVLVYPKYETRGDLADCVSRFRDWLQEKVIDIEVQKGTPSPTVDPSVRVVLCGHSMGGIVAAETLIALTSERVIPPSSASGGSGDGNHTAAPMEGDSSVELNGLMFPYVQAVLSFDTPYLGISPGVVAHGAETHYSTASAALTQLSTLTGLWGAKGAADAGKDDQQRGQQEKKPIAALPPATGGTNKANDSSSTWGSWGKMALYAGAGAALAGSAAAAYLKRDQLTEGWTWVSSHLEFVGCLARGEELRRRVAYMARAQNELGVGFGVLYTRLGKGATALQQQVAGIGGTNMVGSVLGSQRTFCNLPSRRNGPEKLGVWEEAVNDQAGDETSAHMAMFEPKENPGYDKLSNTAADFIAKWSSNDWYESSTEGEIAVDKEMAPEGDMASDSDEDILAKGEVVQSAPPS